MLTFSSFLGRLGALWQCKYLKKKEPWVIADDSTTTCVGSNHIEARRKMMRIDAYELRTYSTIYSIYSKKCINFEKLSIFSFFEYSIEVLNMFEYVKYGNNLMESKAEKKE